MPAKISLSQHLANAQAAAAAKALTPELTGRVLQDARDYWESRLNTATGKPGDSR